MWLAHGETPSAGAKYVGTVEVAELERLRFAVLREEGTRASGAGAVVWQPETEDSPTFLKTDERGHASLLVPHGAFVRIAAWHQRQIRSIAAVARGEPVKIRVLRDGTDPSSSLEIVLTSRRAQAGSPELFTKLGIEPTEKQLIVVKSTQHFHAGFAPISEHVLYAGEHGALQGRFTDIPYRNVATDTYWPFVELGP